MMKTALLATMIALCFSSSNGQTRQAIEPERTMSGLMQGNVVNVSSIEGKPAFQLQLTKAEINDGRLSLLFTNSGNSKTVQATLVGTLAQSSNPWPSGGDRPATRQTQNAEGRVPQEQPNEQTQSLYSAAVVGTGCEVLFLRMDTPKDVQVGVVLRHQDNTRGGDINQAICRVARALEARSDATRALDDLNRLLAGK